MQLSNSEKTLGKIAAGLGILQGVVWLLMSLICIGVYYDGVDLYTMPTSYMEYVNLLIASRFLDINFVENGSPFVLNPGGFSVFMWIYVLWDLLWIVSSAQLLQTIKSPSNKTLKRYQGWASITFSFTLLDIIFSIILLVDYGNCLDYFSIDGVTPLDYGMSCANSTLPVLVIVGRGYILLVVNVIITYLMSSCSISMKKRAIGNNPIQA